MAQDQLKNRLSTIKEVKDIKWPSSDTGGVCPVGIGTRFDDERHRLSDEYTEKWRQYRIKYLKSLVEGHHEPRHVPQWYKMTTNPIRRFYQAPLNLYEKLVTPHIGKHFARQTRNGIAILFGAYCVSLFSYYKFVYSENCNNWELDGRLIAYYSRPVVLPGDPAYPLQNPKPYDWQFFDNGFSKRKSHLNI